MQWDIKGFFDNIPHAPLTKEAERRITDERIKAIFQLFIDAFGPVGMGLGSQISQVCALMVASPIDHLFKDELGVKGYGRYMDDGYAISEDMGFLRNALAKLRAACERIGLKLNEAKTKIVKLTRGFTFLKMRFSISESGAIIRRLGRKTVTAMRRKLKTFYKWYEAGKMLLEDIKTSYQSWRGHARRARSYKTLKTMDRLFISLFGQEGICFSY